MKAPLFSVVLASLVLAGCTDKSSEPTTATNTTSSGNPITAPVDYLGAVAKGQQSAVKTIDTTSINKAIQLFQVDKGRLPNDLNELVQEKYLPHLPETPHGTKLDYDPASGVVKVVKQ